MFGPDEYQFTVKRVGDVTTKLTWCRAELRALRDDLFSDDAAATQDARDDLRDAALLLKSIEGALDSAVERLPAPAARVDSAAAFRALHGGTL